MTELPKAFPATKTDIEPRLMLHVHPTEAEQPKQLGAHYDYGDEAWFIHATQNPYNFAKWTRHLITAQIRAPHYYIAKAQNICRQCHRPTPVFGIIVPKGTLFAADEPPYPYDDRNFLTLQEPVFLMRIEAVPPKSVENIVLAAAKYGISILDTFHFNATIEGEHPHLLNHCEHCNAPELEGDLFHGESLFCPTLDMDQRYLAITKIDKPTGIYSSVILGPHLQLNDMREWDHQPSNPD